MTAVQRSQARRRKPALPRGQGSVYESGGRWYGKLVTGHRADGSPIRTKVVADSAEAAEARLEELRRKVSAGAERLDGNLTTGQWLDAWLDELERSGNVAGGTVTNYRDVVRLYLRPYLGGRRLNKLSPKDVSDLLVAMELDGKSANTRRLARSVLRRSLRKAQERGYVVRNVAALVDGPKVAAAVEEGRTLTPAQAAQLLEAAEGHRLGTAVLVGIVTGLRPGELLGLRWRDVDLEAGIVTVNGALKRGVGGPVWEPLPKTKRSRRSVAAPELVDDLREHKARQAAERLALGAEWGPRGWADHGLVFTTALGTAVDHANYRHHVSRLCQDAGLGHWHPHELRHSAASLALAAGAEPKVVSEMLGHSSIRITMDVYGHLLEGATAAVTGAIAASIRPPKKKSGTTSRA